MGEVAPDHIRVIPTRVSGSRSLECQTFRSEPNAYRFTFNGMEKDDELHGSTGTGYDFGARLYDPRVGKWLSLDAYFKDYPGLSGYAYALDSPTVLRDADGNVVVDEIGRPVTISVQQGEDGKYTATFKLEDGSDVSKTFMEQGGNFIATLIQVSSGRDIVEKMDQTKNHISIVVSKKTRKVDNGYMLGVTTMIGSKAMGWIEDSEGNLHLGESVDLIRITLYDGSIKKAVLLSGEFAERTAGLNDAERRSVVLSHEGVHATHPEHVEIMKKGGDITEEQHDQARELENQVADEFKDK